MNQKLQHRLIINQTEDFATYIWERGKPLQLEMQIISELRPAEVHVIPDGSDNDKPTLIIVQETHVGMFVLAQIDFETLWPAMEACIREIRI